MLPGLGAFAWLCYGTLTSELPGRAVYFLALLVGLALGVWGMVNAYIPTIPENWNTSFLVGWFLISASLWLIATSVIAALCLFVLRTAHANGARQMIEPNNALKEGTPTSGAP